jgi:hypothetical protein
MCVIKYKLVAVNNRFMTTSEELIIEHLFQRGALYHGNKENSSLRIDAIHQRLEKLRYGHINEHPKKLGHCFASYYKNRTRN